jgi:hypothetical protein
MVELNFKQFFTEEDLKNWLLGRPERDDRVSLIPPVTATPESLLGALERAEQTGNMSSIQKARAAIEAHGYSVRTIRTLAPKNRRKAAK